MALRSEKWFFKKSLAEERKRSRLTFLAARSLDLGFGRDNTSGHIRHAVGAAQEFLAAHPGMVAPIRRADPCQPLDLAGAGVLASWLAFFTPRVGRYGRVSFGYNWNTLRGYLTPTLGGIRTGGGGGDNEFQIVLRLVAEFI